MSWVRVDDGFPMHVKVVGLSDEAVALWLRGLCYANASRTDGKIPRAALRVLSLSRKPAVAASELVAARLWDETDSGWQVHDFVEYQASAESRRAMTDAKTKRQKDWRDAHVKPRGSSDVDASTSALHRGGRQPVDTAPTPHPLPHPKEEEDAERASAPASTSSDGDQPTGATKAIYVELCRHPKLRPAADVATAAALSGLVMSGVRVEDIITSIADAAFDLPEGATEVAVRRSLRTYTGNAKKFGNIRRAKAEADSDNDAEPSAAPPKPTADHLARVKARLMAEGDAALRAAQAKSEDAS